MKAHRFNDELRKIKAQYDAGDYARVARNLDLLVHRIDRASEAYSKLHSLRAITEFQLGNLDRAIQMLTMVEERHRTYMYYIYAAQIQSARKDHKAAEASIMRALKLAPKEREVHQIAGVIYHQARHYLDALRQHDQAMDREGGFPNADIMNNKGNTLKALGRDDEAREYFKSALKLKPVNATIWANLGSLELRIGEYDAAIEAYSRALRLDPRNASANFGIGLIALIHGDLVKGLELYEWRWKANQNEVKWPWPKWDGNVLHIEELRYIPQREFRAIRLLLVSEQGYGDTLMMARYIPRLDSMGLILGVHCHPSLHRLIAGNFPYVILEGEVIDPASYDFHIPMMGLPHVLGVTMDSLKREWFDRSYLKTVSLYDHPTTIMKVGYCYKGNPEHDNDLQRSMSIDTFNRVFIGLSGKMLIFNVTDGEQIKFNDWQETAEYLLSLDLLITVDTAVAHLAGALGIEVWLMLPYAPDWRWLLPDLPGMTISDRSSLWYRSMTLYRQPQFGDWKSVVEQVNADLIRLVGAWKEPQSSASGG